MESKEKINMSANKGHLDWKDILSVIIVVFGIVFIFNLFGNLVGSCIKDCYGRLAKGSTSQCYDSVTGTPPASIGSYIANSVTTNDYSWNFPPNKTLYAVLISTNIVSQPCPCGFCDNARGIRVPEHIGVIGYDLKLVVSTNYLPVLYIH